MFKSILQFCEKGTEKLDNLSGIFFENPTQIAEFVYGVTDVVIKLGCDFIGEVFGQMDEAIRQNGLRKKKWEVVRKDCKSMLTSLGEISFEKTLYKDKRTGERTYLLDRYLGIEEKSRMTEDAEAKILEEAVETSYRRGGEAVSITDKVSKSTVKNRIHGLNFPEILSDRALTEKKQVKYLYIDADEDHVPLQYLSSNAKDSNNDSRKQTIVKLVYVYEGIEKEAPESKRFKLINPYYFSGIYEDSENEKLWEEVYEYIDSVYDLDSVERIYLNSDGGNWIKTGVRKIHGITRVMDEYHINKYLTQMTTHLYDSAQDGRDLLREAIRNGSKEEFCRKVDMLLGYTDDDNSRKRIADGRDFILRDWTATKLRLLRRSGVVGSSTEGHVSHILSSRMSSRPMGWSKSGADRMAKLRAYSRNGGDMLKLVRYQKRHVDREVMQDKPLTIKDLVAWENASRRTGGKYADRLQHSVSIQARKILAIRDFTLAL